MLMGALRMVGHIGCMAVDMHMGGASGVLMHMKVQSIFAEPVNDLQTQKDKHDTDSKFQRSGRL